MTSTTLCSRRALVCSSLSASGRGGAQAVRRVRRAGLAWLLFGGVAAMPRLALAQFDERVRVDSATEEQKAAATRLFESGLDSFKAGSHEDALRLFRESQATVASPNTRFMIARALIELGRLDEAYTELGGALADAEVGQATGGDYKATEAAVRKKHAELSSRIALLELDLSKLPEGTKVAIGKRELSEAELAAPVPVLPGKVVVTARAPDGQQGRQVVSASAGGRHSVTPTVSPRAEEGSESGSFVGSGAQHVAYVVEAELHAMGTVSNVQGPGTAQSAGAGARLTLELLSGGLVQSLVDDLAFGAGADYVAGGPKPHWELPGVLHYGLWLAPRVAVLAEAGATLLVGDTTKVLPTGSLGARVLLTERVDLIARVGVPSASLGAAYLF